MQCFVSTLVGFPMSVTCWPRLCGSSPPSERPVAALWTPWSPTGVMSIAIPLGVTTPDTSYSDMAAGSEWVLPHGWGERKTGGCQRADLESGCRIGASAFSAQEKGAAGPLAVWEMGINKCRVMEIGKFDKRIWGKGEFQQYEALNHVFLSAWLVNLYSSAGSRTFAVPRLDVGMVQTKLLFQQLHCEGSASWTFLSVEPFSSDLVPVLCDWFVETFGVWQRCETASAWVGTFILFLPLSRLQGAHLREHPLESPPQDHVQGCHCSPISEACWRGLTFLWKHFTSAESEVFENQEIPHCDLFLKPC